MSKPMNLEVVARPHESAEKLIGRFLKKFKKKRLGDEIKEHEYYRSPSERRRESKKRAESSIKKAQAALDELNSG